MTQDVIKYCFDLQIFILTFFAVKNVQKNVTIIFKNGKNVLHLCSIARPQVFQLVCRSRSGCGYGNPNWLQVCFKTVSYCLLSRADCCSANFRSSISSKKLCHTECQTIPLVIKPILYTPCFRKLCKNDENMKGLMFVKHGYFIFSNFTRWCSNAVKVRWKSIS